jgi:peptide chain release factor
MSLLLQITSGRGPVECCWVVARLSETMQTDASRQGLCAAVIEEEPGTENGTLFSAMIHIDGDGCNAYAASWVGTVQWIGNSPFRHGHKRKNWFVGVNL